MRKLYFLIFFLIRWPLYVLKKVRMGRMNFIERGVFLSKSQIGSYNYIGHYTIIDKAIIGNYCSIASGVMVGGAEHPYSWWSTSFRLCEGTVKPTTTIEDDVWIGAKASIRAGVRIGRGAVIGSHSLILKDVPPYAIVVGSPGKLLKYRFGPERIAVLDKVKYWEREPQEAKDILQALDSKI